MMPRTELARLLTFLYYGRSYYGKPELGISTLDMSGCSQFYILRSNAPELVSGYLVLEFITSR